MGVHEDEDTVVCGVQDEDTAVVGVHEEDVLHWEAEVTAGADTDAQSVVMAGSAWAQLLAGIFQLESHEVVDAEAPANIAVYFSMF